MSESTQHLWTLTSSLLDRLGPLKDVRPEAPIGDAARTFNDILREAKSQLPNAPLVQGMQELKATDSLLTYVSQLTVLEAEASPGHTPPKPGPRPAAGWIGRR